MAKATATPATPATPDVNALAAAIAQLLGGAAQFSTPAAVADVVAPEAPAKTPEFDAKAFVEGKGFALNKGRTSGLTNDVITATARVLKTGKPEIVATAGGRNSHVLVFRATDGTVAIQNLRKEA